MLNPVYIYALCDVDYIVRYVGATVNLKHRFKRHLIPFARQENSLKAKWLDELDATNTKPIIQVLEITDEENRTKRERHWIEYYQLLGFPLTNLINRGLPCPKEQRKHIGDGNRGKVRTEETKKKLSEAAKRKWQGPIGQALIARYREEYKNQVFTEETRRKISEAVRSRPKKTHCKNGHELSGGNVYINPTKGTRHCRICTEVSRTKWEAKHKENNPKPKKTHCKHGHPWTGENIWVRPGDGRRECRICKNERKRKDWKREANV